MARTTPEEYMEKWGRRLKGAGQDIRAGVERTTVAPGIAAAQASDKMLAGITEALNSGKWQRAVAGVSLQDWKEATVNKGINRIAAGVDASMSKNRVKVEKLLSDVDSSVSEIARMPSTTFQDRIQRMVSFSEAMHRRSQQS
jgi:hypothetical protein